MRKDQGCKIITRFKDPHEFVETEYGTIKYKKWCKNEVKRIGDCKIVEDEDGFIALGKI